MVNNTGTLLIAILLLGLCTAQTLASSSAISSLEATREFRIDYEGDQFLLDGQPFQYVSGSMHYFRVLSVDWRDRLQKLRAAGLNAVSTYVEWSQHEPSPGVYNFDGDLDLVKFIEIAQEEGLLVILRVGPFICGERDFGGFPSWLLKGTNTIKLRAYDAGFLDYTDKWLKVLMPKINPLLYGNGGPIIMVQAENEYGFYDQCDSQYKEWLGNLFSSYIGNAAVLFTTDGAAGDAVRCGQVPGALATVDFYPGYNVTEAFEDLRKYVPHGPLVNSEFYPGWGTHWEENWSTRSTESVITTLEEILLANASLNFYMFMGGTSFGFTSGANFGSDYQATLTSYDFDAPLTEAGDPTEKYMAIRNVIGKYLPLPDVPVPEVAPKGAYDAVDVSYVASVLDPQLRQALGRKTVSSSSPMTFENLDQSYGFVMYETIIPTSFPDPTLLKVHGIRDRAVVWVDGVKMGILSRGHNVVELPINAEQGQTLQLFVENQGRVNFGGNDYLRDVKGIIGDVVVTDFGNNDYILENWEMTGFPMDNISWIETQPTHSGISSSLPAFFRGEFILPAGEPLDTFVDMTGFDKGVVFINGHNLGRYWISAGPIHTLYVPRSFLLASPSKNNLVVLELEKIPSTPQVKFVTEHIIVSRN